MSLMRPVPAVKDSIYSESRENIGDFHFGEETTAVFDDMLSRSVPFYHEIQRMIAELAAEFAQPGTSVVDLGSSTGTSILRLGAAIPRSIDVRFVGVDSSPEMIEKAHGRLAEAGFDRPVELRLADLNEGVAIENASIVLLVLTLQFVRPLHRERLVRSIHDGLAPGGCLILVEKILGESSTLNRLFIKNYYEMKKRNGYSELEIAQKREALENVLIPYRLEENKELLRRVGFGQSDVFFQWYNFCAMVAVK
jgi:tRNA (cmo5U34)-methyltransferase